MGFNRRKMEDQRRQAAEKEAASRRATDAQVLEDAERLIAAWNERQAKRTPMLFLTISAAVDGSNTCYRHQRDRIVPIARLPRRAVGIRYSSELGRRAAARPWTFW
jgi:hypothetical protein